MKFSKPSRNPKVRTAVRLIMGSVNSMVPTAFLGSSPDRIRAGVPRGPIPCLH